MSRVLVNNFFYLSRRSYAVAAAAEASRTSASAVRAAAKTDSSGTSKEEIFWMRDPKTGNWIPENRFSDVDVAELRARLLKPTK